VLLLVCATSLGGIAIISAIFPATERATNRLIGVFFALLGVAFAIMVATGFHIAVTDALQRIERREKDSTRDERIGRHAT
jgi:uncharacterized membrane protein YciS (DUF1049 family)